jgi:uracil-DNA glycosylase family 4
MKLSLKKLIKDFLIVWVIALIIVMYKNIKYKMSGFFTVKETQSQHRPDGKVLSCHSCGLYRKANSPKMKPFGNFKKGIMNIGSVPDTIDDEKGKQWQGASGKYLKNIYNKLGVDLFEDCVNLNAINCHSGKLPKPFEIDCCRRIVLNAIEQYKPKVIILFGDYPLKSIIGNRWKDSLDGIVKWRGWTIPDQDLKTWVCLTLNPKYVMRMEKNRGVERVLIEDLERAFSKVNEPFPYFKEPEIITLENDLSVLDTIPPLSIVAFDYETTGLKPHAKGHRIVSASVAVNENKAYVFLIPNKAKDRAPLKRLLKNKLIKKIAQNIKYEHTWSREILKTTVRNWYWDTMLATHVLDNRKGVTGLKFQAYVQFGIVNYNSAVDKALKAPESNDLNSIMEFIKKPKNRAEMLKYNALDSIFTYRLFLLQQEKFNSLLPF